MSIKCTVCGSVIIASDPLDIKNLMIYEKRISDLEAQLDLLRVDVNTFKNCWNEACHDIGKLKEQLAAKDALIKEYENTIDPELTRQENENLRLINENSILRTALEKYATEEDWQVHWDVFMERCSKLKDLWIPDEHGYTIAQEAIKKMEKDKS